MVPLAKSAALATSIYAKQPSLLEILYMKHMHVSTYFMHGCVYQAWYIDHSINGTYQGRSKHLETGPDVNTVKLHPLIN